MTNLIKPTALDALQAKISQLQQFIDSHKDMQLVLDHSASWMDGRIAELQTSRAFAWRVTIGAGVLSLLAFAIAYGAIRTSMQPAPPPEILVVNRVTGEHKPLISLAEYQMSPEESTIRRDLTTFLRARRNYTWHTAIDNYQDAAAFMDARGQAQWAEYYDSNNPKSPTMVYKKEGNVRIELGAITINRNGDGQPISARTSFVETIKRNDTLVGAPITWIATCPFHHATASASERDRRINPLGIVFPDCQYDVDVGAAAGALTPQAAPTPPAAPAPSMALMAPQDTPARAP